MAKLKWAIPCLVASIDRFTNSVSLTHIIDEIGLSANISEHLEGPDKPLAVQPGFAFVSLWERTEESKPEKFQARLTFVGPATKKGKGKGITGLAFTIDLSVAQRGRNVSRFGHLPFVGFGDYAFQLHTRIDEREKWKKVADIPFQIKPIAATTPSDVKHLIAGITKEIRSKIDT